MNTERPKVSFGLPVRNGERFLRRALDSILAQEFQDYEVILCDNDSRDATGAIGREYARRDPRIRYARNERDFGAILNFNRTFELSRGDYFRWITHDDWLEPAYTSRCVAVLDASPHAVGVTTLWKLVADDGQESARSYRGKRVDSTSVFSRVRATLRLLHSDALYFDPCFSLLRVTAIAKSGGYAANTPEDLLWADPMMALSLALQGPFCHIEEMLCGKRDPHEPAVVRLQFRHPSLRDARVPPVYTKYTALFRVANKNLVGWQKISAGAAILCYWIREEVLSIVRRVRGVAGRVFRRTRTAPAAVPPQEPHRSKYSKECS
jgi:glycosyltransferase involved in cell wall biosynthesis